MRRRIPIFIAVAVSVLIFLYPIARLFEPALTSAFPDSEVSLLIQTTALSLLQACLSVLGALILGVPIGFWVGRSIGPATRATLLSLYSMPTMVVATAMLSLLQNSSSRYSLVSVVAAHSLLNAPWIALTVAEGFRDFPSAWLNAARSLGAHRRVAIRDFVIPFIRVSLFTATLQVFTLCWMSFTIVLLLGGGPPISTLETEIYASFRMGEIQLERAALYALVQMGIGLVPVLFWVYFSRRQARWSSAIRVEDVQKKKSGNPWAAWLLFLPYALFLKNVIVLPATSWRAVLLDTRFYQALGSSLKLALVTGLITLTLGVFYAWIGKRSPLVRVLANFPAGVSTLVLAAGFFFAYGAGTESAFLWIALVQSVTLLPIAFRWIYPRFGIEDVEAMTVARSLGASSLRAFRDVELWKWKKTLFQVFGLAAVWSLGEYAVIAFLGSGGGGEQEFLPQYIAHLYSRYAFDEAQVAAFALFVFTWAGLRFMMSRGGRFDVA